ncbi:hypothetical protein VNO80_21729 [Phaseolus coccineus]|uniref:Uncharacterized protein n=1 Tax=Phaseolus coccineus TaxID=3886 RepID=A0AAN9M3L5_PHACN
MFLDCVRRVVLVPCACDGEGGDDQEQKVLVDDDDDDVSDKGRGGSLEGIKSRIGQPFLPLSPLMNGGKCGKPN